MKKAKRILEIQEGISAGDDAAGEVQRLTGRPLQEKGGINEN